MGGDHWLYKLLLTITTCVYWWPLGKVFGICVCVCKNNYGTYVCACRPIRLNVWLNGESYYIMHCIADSPVPCVTLCYQNAFQSIWHKIIHSHLQAISNWSHSLPPPVFRSCNITLQYKCIVSDEWAFGKINESTFVWHRADFPW